MWYHMMLPEPKSLVSFKFIDVHWVPGLIIQEMSSSCSQSCICYCCCMTAAVKYVQWPPVYSETGNCSINYAPLGACWGTTKIAPHSVIGWEQISGASLTNISNFIHYNVWDEITYPFSNFNSCTIEVWECISDFIPCFKPDVIT